MAFRIDLNETFPHLAEPPIVEAVIHWQARGQASLDQEELQEALKTHLPDYAVVTPIQQVEFMAMVSQDVQPVVQQQQNWQGYRLKSADDRYTVQFKRDGLVFSRTNGYEDWKSFAADAKIAWRAFTEIARPLEIQRLGVRFINHLSAATPESVGEFLRDPPTCPSNLPLKDFVYQSTFNVPGQPFSVRVVKVLQPQLQGPSQSSGLFLDIDVFTTNAIENDEATLDNSLATMRWLKNKIFFSLLSDNAFT